MSLSHADQLASMEGLAQAIFAPNKAAHFTPFILGLVYATTLFGVAICQFINWAILDGRTERKSVRCLVYYLIFASTAYTVYTVAFILRIFAFNFGAYSLGLDYSWSSVYYLLTMTLIAPSQGFYIQRLYRLSGNNKFVLAATCTMLVGTVGLAIATKIYAPAIVVFAVPLEFTLVKAWLALGALLDLSLTAGITYRLWRSRTGWSETDKLITMLVVLSVEAGLAPALLALAYLLVVVARPTSTWVFLFLGTPMSFVITILAIFNSRREMRREIEAAAMSGRNTYKPGKESFVVQMSKDVDLAVDITDAHLPGLTYSLNRAPASPDRSTFRPSSIPITSLPVHSQAYPNISPEPSPSALYSNTASPNPFSRPLFRASPFDDDTHLRGGNVLTLTPNSADVAQLQHEMHSLHEALRVDGADEEMMKPLEEDEMKPFDDVDLGRVDKGKRSVV